MSLHELLLASVKRLLVSSCLILATLWTQSQVHGQNVGVSDTTSTPVPGVPHDFITGLNEVVNPANGSVSVRIKAPTPYERGVNWPTHALIYDSNNQFGLSPVWTSSVSSNSTFYALTALNLINQASQLGQTHIQQITLPSGQYTTTTYQCQVSYGYVFRDPEGGNHGMGLGSTLSVTPAGACGVFPNASNYYVGGDEQYKAVLTPSATVNVNPTVSIIDSHGNVVAVEDVNGNLASATTGRIYSGAQTATGYTLTVPGVTTPAGAAAPYVLTTEAAVSPSISMALTQVSSSSNGNTCQLSSAKYLPPAGTNPYVLVKTVEIPDGESYSFQYDSTFGLLSQITYPTGATVAYTWSLIPNMEGVQYRAIPGGAGSLCALTYSWYAITKRVVSVPNSSGALVPTEEQDFVYNTTWPTAGGQYSYRWNTKTTTVTTKDLLRSTSFKTVYSYSPALPPPAGDPAGSWGDQGYMPQESTIQYYDASANLLKTVTKTWQTLSLLSGECETLPNGQTSGKFFQYQPYTGFSSQDQTPLNPNANLTNLPTDVAEFDYGTVSSACTRPTTTPLRETKTAYASFGITPQFPYTSILDRPSTVQIYGNGSLLAETDYAYDGGTPPTGVGSTPPTVVSPTPIGQDPQYETANITTRGNPTTVTKKCFVGGTACTNSVTTYAYDTTGQVLTATDAKGNSTYYSYKDNYTNGGPSGSTNAYMTTLTEPPTNGVTHITHFTWGWEDGKMWNTTDQNAQTTIFCYTVGGCGGSTFDPFYRLTGVQYPDTGQEKVAYSDAGPMPSVSTSTLLSGSSWLTRETIYDALSRPITSALTSDPAGTDYTSTTYDGLGHIWTVTNPYRSTGDSTYGTITYTYDALDRKIQQQQQDNTKLQWCYDNIKTIQGSCSLNLSRFAAGDWVDSYDETGIHTQHVSDGLGRLISVMEPNGTNAPSIETDYSYDGLGNLLSVNQTGVSGETARSRSFMYDSLSRLLVASNAETGVVCYGVWSALGCTNASDGYDANGNLVGKTDYRGVTTAYSYDALNRLVAKTYSDGTLSSCYQYDSAGTNGIGRLGNAWTQTGSCPSSVPSSGFFTLRSISTYDSMGRLKAEQQCTPSQCTTGSGPQLSYGFDPGGDPVNLTNTVGASGGQLALNATFDTAAHANNVSSSWSAYATNLYSLPTGGYGPVGPLNWTLGSNLNITQNYTNRLWINNVNAVGQVP